MKYEYGLAVQEEHELLTQKCEKVNDTAIIWVTRASKTKTVRRA